MSVYLQVSIYSCSRSQRIYTIRGAPLTQLPCRLLGQPTASPLTKFIIHTSPTANDTMTEDRLTNDASIQRSVRQQREKFVQQLRGRESELLQLASRVCGQASCHFFKPDALGTHFVRGSYNVSFFIQFPDGQRCVLRIPNRPCWAYCPRRKLQSEVATMQYMRPTPLRNMCLHIVGISHKTRRSRSPRSSRIGPMRAPIR